ncbi:MAG: hypothetical protein Q8O00_04295 [Holophaga sp.]|nr:hypothetical protein [Holophaga sp.]
MDDAEVPQEDNVIFKGLRKAVYARGVDGKVRPVPSTGWQVEEIVTRQALDLLATQAEEARQRALRGEASPLEFHMCCARMDLALLSQCTGIWQWRVRRHFRPEVFAKLSDQVLGRYSEATGVPVEKLRNVEP